jgi:hypothetical protein
MNVQRAIGFWVLIGLSLAGCSGTGPRSTAAWTAQPESRSVDHPLFEAMIVPQKGEAPYYVSFLLTVTNKSDADLMVDWNSSRYLFNGRPEGALVFEGIDPEMVKTATVPGDAIAPGGLFSRVIMPLRLIAWSPLKESTASSRSITPGMLPAGENGIRLAVQHDTGPIAIPLSIRIVRETSP